MDQFRTEAEQDMLITGCVEEVADSRGTRRMQHESIRLQMCCGEVKTRMQLQNLSATETVRQIMQTTGPRGLYAGMSAMLLQVSCKAAIRCAAGIRTTAQRKRCEEVGIAQMEVATLQCIGQSKVSFFQTLSGLSTSTFVFPVPLYRRCPSGRCHDSQSVPNGDSSSSEDPPPSWV